ncbi:MAG: hypothetical protein PHC61_00770 [Chitinivibrionales bacterium]|nr:hypothetical protein [Chitinivibrionales bacterium]
MDLHIKFNRFRVCILAALAIVLAITASSAHDRANTWGQKFFTIQSAHTIINYPEGSEAVARRIADIIERLYGIYTNTYHCPLPEKVEVIVSNDDPGLGNGFSSTVGNIINIYTNAMDYDLRGTPDWLPDVVAHEFAHHVSIRTALKYGTHIPYLQLGYFDAPNQPVEGRVMHVLGSDNLPHWFSEGIAQFESTRNKGDSWDTHRDMVLRSMVLDHLLLSPQRMATFAGREDESEKSYNQGFALVRFIEAKWGYEKVVQMLRKSAPFYRFGFNAAVKTVLGISMEQLYKQWKQDAQTHYQDQTKSLGPLVTGKKISKEGFDNVWPRFSVDGKKLYFLSNGKNDYAYSFKSLYSYSFADTIPKDKRIKAEMNIGSFYDLSPRGGLVAYTSTKSGKSTLPSRKGGWHARDVFIDSLPPEKEHFVLFPKKTERQVTKKMSAFGAAFSPRGDMLAFYKRDVDKFYLGICDTAGKKTTLLYPLPQEADSAIATIFSIDWSGDGHRIAISYIDTHTRKIGIYDTLTQRFEIFNPGAYDNRDPRFSRDGAYLYFSSDRSGIFNIYRYCFADSALEKLTNVIGGAFMPAVSGDTGRLAFADYDSGGYAINCIDTIRPLDRRVLTAAVSARAFEPLDIPKTSSGAPRLYHHVPHQFLLMPTLILENMPQGYNPFAGLPVLQGGVIVNVYDPFSWVETGTMLGGYLLFEPQKIFQFLNFDRGFIDPHRTYEGGIFGSTQVLPVDLSAQLLQRTVADRSTFFNEAEQASQALDYSQTVRDLDVAVSYPFGGGFSVGAKGGLNWYDIYLAGKEVFGADFPYNLAKGSKIGLYASLLSQEPNTRMNISPLGLAARLGYDFWDQDALKDENSFDQNGREQYDNYRYHEVDAALKLGISAPWYDRHALYAEMNAAAISLTDASKRGLAQHGLSEVPVYYEVGNTIPGYAYFYNDTAYKLVSIPPQARDSTGRAFDSIPVPRQRLMLTGNAVATASVSYRFPIGPRTLDCGLGFLYLDKLYGCLNGAWGGALQTLAASASWSSAQWRDWFLNQTITSAGAELRLEALSFNSYPMAVSLRWDRGLTYARPLGGDRFTFTIGFSFDNWDAVGDPLNGNRAAGALHSSR